MIFPARIPSLMVRDLIAYRNRALHTATGDVNKRRKEVHGIMVINFHDKGIEMGDLPNILLYLAFCQSLILQ